MIYYVLVLFCQKTAEIYIPLSLNCKYMMNQNSSGFLSSIPMVTKNLIIINLLFWVASLVLPKVGIDLVQLFGLHFPGVKDFYPFQFVTYMFMHDTHSFAHVFFNMFGVYMFGRVLENVWGPKRFLIFYMVTGIGAGTLGRQCGDRSRNDPAWCAFDGARQFCRNSASVPGDDVTLRAEFPRLQ